ncbi:unnamed protein product [Nippostrongylus brasiliensis]|uniref:PDZ domain-containing protein n=1 Tax=Nippostrongylus brasiliensis TaxID=27835 RepID=A0A0N4Y6R9_NIPBR|nr:unnamed protein product [Nippostrongylus brasiliensis]
MQGNGAQEPAIEDDMATPQGAQDRDKMAVWHLNKRGSSTKEKEDGATIVKDVPRGATIAMVHFKENAPGAEERGFIIARKPGSGIDLA